MDQKFKLPRASLLINPRSEINIPPLSDAVLGGWQYKHEETHKRDDKYKTFSTTTQTHQTMKIKSRPGQRADRLSLLISGSGLP